MANYGGGPGSPYNMPPPPQRPSAPASVVTAVKFMYAGAALSVIGLVIGFTQKDAIRRAIVANNPNLTDSQINVGVNVGLAFGIFSGLVGLGLWLWMAYANRKGYAWARIVSTVLFGIDTLALIFILTAASSTAPSKGAGILLWLVALGAVVFLWRPDASAYFNTP